jgi:uncharacterized protein (DUF488 family)
VFTAGFSTLAPERFLNNLRTYDIQILADVRSRPYSRHAPQFNKEQAERLARQAGLEYVFLGRELGGMPDDPRFYDPKGHVLYDRIAAEPWFETGIQTVLASLGRGRKIVLTCAEDDPRACHRRLLVGRVLRERGVGLAHILANGGLISESELLDEEAALPRQAALFGIGPARQWRSARPLATRPKNR